ncbi:MAG: SpoIIE family protein phosphatase [Oscillospiraceae bacterium]|nr:SpoIIE family protein phosphatase [Oscillospiraceae bacterium]
MMTGTQLKGRNIYRAGKGRVLKIPEKHIILLCAASVVTAYSDINFASLPLIFVVMCRERTSRYICASSALLCFASTVVTGSFYIPYMSFVFIYLIADCLLMQNSRYSIYFSSAVFAAVKGYVLSFGYSSVYWAVMALELAAFFLVPRAVQSGVEHLRENSEVLTSVQTAECAAALAVASMALAGVKVWGINIPLCFLMSCCFFYGTKNNMLLSVLSAVMTAFVLCNEKHFSFIFIGLLLTATAAFVLLQKGNAGYFATFASALAVAIVFMPRFNSSVIIVTVSVSLTVCFVAVKYSKPVKKNTDRDTTGENDYYRLIGNVDRLGRAFRFLGHTVMDISDLISKNTVPAEMQDIVAGEVCRRCAENHICWQENYSCTQKQFSELEKAAKKGEHFSFEPLFASRCGKTDKLAESFEGAAKLVSTQQLIGRAGQHSRQILQNQFLAMAQTLQDIVSHSCRSGIANTAFTHTLNSFLAAMGKKVNYCICFQDSGRCVISTADYFTPSETERIKTKLESVYGTKFDLPCKEDESGGTVYTFIEKAGYTTEFSCRSKSRYKVCGDVCEEFAAEEYRYVVLADGMGTGSYASAESRTAVAMLKKLLTAGISPLTAAEITNIALNLKGTGQSCVAADILQINCYSGKCALYSAGGAPARLISGTKSRIIYKESLPIGILRDTKLAKTEFELKNGDTVVLMSDGVRTDGILSGKLALMAEKCTAEEMAEFIISHQDSADDATAAAVKFTRI